MKIRIWRTNTRAIPKWYSMSSQKLGTHKRIVGCEGEVRLQRANAVSGPVVDAEHCSPAFLPIFTKEMSHRDDPNYNVRNKEEYKRDETRHANERRNTKETSRNAFTLI